LDFFQKRGIVDGKQYSCNIKVSSQACSNGLVVPDFYVPCLFFGFGSLSAGQGSAALWHHIKDINPQRSTYCEFQRPVYHTGWDLLYLVRKQYIPVGDTGDSRTLFQFLCGVWAFRLSVQGKENSKYLGHFSDVGAYPDFNTSSVQIDDRN
jgi:hypothetical protein